MDLTVAAVPVFFSSMAGEQWLVKRRAEQPTPSGIRGPARSDYERQDTIASLTMGTASLFVPLVTHFVADHIAPQRSRVGRGLVGAPYGLLCLAGIRPALIEQARGINLLYQFWIHTDMVRRMGPLEEVLNTPSHHRAHHGVNKQYLDRNHGSILITWDRLFGTFEREEEAVVYGLTTNIETFRPWGIATHEYRDMLDDVGRADTWHDRLSYVLRGPGWAYERRREFAAASSTSGRQEAFDASTASLPAASVGC